MKPLTYLFLILTACTASPSEEPISPSATVITDVGVVDVRSGQVVKGQYVVVDSGKIVQLLDTIDVFPSEATVIDGSGKFLMPGLAEMHAHIPSPEQGQAYLENTLFLYLANGVTTIRGMLGHPRHLELREQAAANQLLSPRIFTSSPSLNGNTVQTVEEARSKVTTYQQDGYDFLKLHPGIQLAVFDEIAKTANEVGIPFAGHVPVDVGIRHALESEYASVDHVDGFLEGLVPSSAGVAPDENGFFGYNFTKLADTTAIDELVQMTKEHGVWVVPTQSLFDRWFSPEDAEQLAQAPEMKYIPKAMLDEWINSKQSLVGEDSYDSAQWAQFNDIRNQLMLRLHKNGQGLLLGSDAPQVFNVPGFSIHHELQAMLRAGLTPLEALQIGTLHPARFFNQEGEIGEVVEGAGADLILLDVSPLEDLEALKNPAGVMVRGQWLSRQAIDTRLAAIAKENQQSGEVE